MQSNLHHRCHQGNASIALEATRLAVSGSRNGSSFIASLEVDVLLQASCKGMRSFLMAAASNQLWLKAVASIGAPPSGEWSKAWLVEEACRAFVCDYCAQPFLRAFNREDSCTTHPGIFFGEAFNSRWSCCGETSFEAPGCFVNGFHVGNCEAEHLSNCAESCPLCEVKQLPFGIVHHRPVRHISKYSARGRVGIGALSTLIVLAAVAYHYSYFLQLVGTEHVIHR